MLHVMSVSNSSAKEGLIVGIDLGSRCVCVKIAYVSGNLDANGKVQEEHYI